MQVYRIASTDYINDLSGYGAKLYGGRWNRKGVAVLYTGSSIALCAWEYWVHLPDQITLRQNAFSVATIEIPDSSMLVVTSEMLPKSWPQEDAQLHKLTDTWIDENRYLAMQVPSSVIASEFNFLINPAHLLADNINLLRTELFQFDKRAFGKQLLD